MRPERSPDRPTALLVMLLAVAARLTDDAVTGDPERLRTEVNRARETAEQLAAALIGTGGRVGPEAQRAVDAARALRALRALTARERRAREMAEAQQLRAVEDFRTMYRQAGMLTGRLEEAYITTVSALARAVEARDLYTGGHVERVRALSTLVGQELGLSSGELRQLEFGALLHDIGKIGIPDVVLTKDGPLDTDEWRLMRSHPEIGRQVLEGIAFLRPALDAVACHHERWDGRGYPGGLAGERIPLFGRIVAVADSYDAMTTDRPYRTGLPLHQAVAEIARGAGAQYDPAIVRAFHTSLARVA